MTEDVNPRRVAALCSDLAAEGDALDGLVRGLDESGWSAPTPAPGWSIRDQISHLAFFDGTALMALTDPVGFARHVEEISVKTGQDRQSAGDTDLGRTLSGPELLAHWRAGRDALVEAARSAPPDQRIPWYALPMSPASFVTARLMETWAHGQDVVDALGDRPIVSERLRHVCDIGVRARRYSFKVNRLGDPGDPVRVELSSPTGAPWGWGEEGAADRVVGSALDFALVVTQRRHPDDTALDITGVTATQWMQIAQAFAGPAGEGRRPGLRRVEA